MAAGNRHLGYKEALNAIEERSPGSKGAFVAGFFDRAQPRFAADAAEERHELSPCAVCGAPTPGQTHADERRSDPICAFCRLRARAVGEPIPLRNAP